MKDLFDIINDINNPVDHNGTLTDDHFYCEICGQLTVDLDSEFDACSNCQDASDSLLWRYDVDDYGYQIK